jgi:hypothetical protein
MPTGRVREFPENIKFLMFHKVLNNVKSLELYAEPALARVGRGLLIYIVT